jgi:hypothetical protein
VFSSRQATVIGPVPPGIGARRHRLGLGVETVRKWLNQAAHNFGPSERTWRTMVDGELHPALGSDEVFAGDRLTTTVSGIGCAARHRT